MLRTSVALHFPERLSRSHRFESTNNKKIKCSLRENLQSGQNWFFRFGHDRVVKHFENFWFFPLLLKITHRNDLKNCLGYPECVFYMSPHLQIPTHTIHEVMADFGKRTPTRLTAHPPTVRMLHLKKLEGLVTRIFGNFFGWNMNFFFGFGRLNWDYIRDAGDK